MIPDNFTPRDYQLDFLRQMDGIEGKPETKKRRALLKWHRRAGKDKVCYCFLVKEAYQVPGNYFYIFPTREDAKKALWENIDSDGFRTILHIPESVARFQNQEMRIDINCMNGGTSTIRVVGYDKNPDSIRGIACKGAILSEWAFSDPEIVKILIPAVMQSKGFLIINSTPSGEIDHVEELWEKVKDSNHWFTSKLQTWWPERENYSALVPKEELQQLIDDGIEDEEDIEREFGVSSESGRKGSIFTRQLAQAQEAGRIGTYGWDSNRPVDTLFDIGQNDVTAIWFLQQDGNMTNFIDYYEESGQGTDSLARMLKDKGYDYTTHILPHDAEHKHQGREVKSFRESFEESLDAFQVTGNCIVLERIQDKNMSIKEVRRCMSMYRWDSLKCASGLRHLESYHRKYDKKRRTFLNEPEHDEHSNAADAIRMESESKNSRTAFKNKSWEKFSTDEYNVWDF